jgi:hypothetical protein
MDDEDNEKKEAVSNVVQGLVPIDPAVLNDFLREMNEEVIPEIVKAIEERRLLAAENRHRQLKC